jgi:membrane-associated protein
MKSMLPGFDLDTFAANAGPLAVVLVLAFIIFAESGLLIGFFLPGDTILFTAGFLVNTDVLKIDLHLLAFTLFLAAVAGDSIGYLFGKRVGHKIFRRPDSLLFKHENIEKAEQFYEKYGAVTIIIARFIPVVRTFAPIVAGVGKMNYRKFLLYNVIGAFAWAGGVVYAGYFIGVWLESIGINIDTILFPIIVIVVTITFLSPLLHTLSRKEERIKLMKRLKSLLFLK